MYVIMYICIVVSMYVYMYRFTFLCLCRYQNTYMHRYIQIYIYIHTCIDTYRYTHRYLFVPMYLCMYVSCIYGYACTYVFMSMASNSRWHHERLYGPDLRYICMCGVQKSLKLMRCHHQLAAHRRALLERRYGPESGINVTAYKCIYVSMHRCVYVRLYKRHDSCMSL